MASVLKRKRGIAEVADTPKRSKSNKVSANASDTPFGKSSEWDSFPTAGKDLVLAETNGVNGNGVTSPEAVDFDTANDKNFQEAEDERLRKAQQHEQAQKALKKAIRRREQQSWRLSEPIGGRFINADPLFTAGEKFLIVANRTTIQIYSTANSLLHRSIKVKLNVNARIVTFCLSPTRENILWVAASDGSIFSLDWTTGAGSEQYWGVSSTGCTHMTVASMESAGRRRDVVITTEPRKGGGWRITANELAPPNSKIQTAAKTIYTSTHRINMLKTACEGAVIVAAADNAVMIGSLRAADFDTIDKIRYEFRIFECTEAIASLDIKVVDRAPSKELPKPILKLPMLHVAVGGVMGSIFYFMDILAKLVMAQKGSLPPGYSVAPKKLHWHRQAVYTVKFSLDGNYIISGGTETVLLLWQMDTGKQQYLPHMTATIQNLTVSPTGSSYAVQLADNSAIILSTAELEPTANIAGIQANIVQAEESVIDSVKRVEDAKWGNLVIQKTPAVLSPSDPGKLILAVGPVQETRRKNPHIMSNPFLQTFDMGSGTSVARQAIARNNVTNVNITPNAHRLSEPRTVQMKISGNGEWLATVDEWIPPAQDLEYLASQSHEVVEEQLSRREVFLKFWQWSQDSNTWELITRIDSPHLASQDVGIAGRVLDLVTDPAATRFATVGEDGIVRTWVPTTRRRDGVEVKDKGGVVYKNWVCQHIVSMGNLDLSDALSKTTESAQLAFSEDGSVLAAASGLNEGVMHLIDLEVGTIKHTETGLFNDAVLGLEFLGRDLIILSNHLSVYDLVTLELKSSTSLVTDLPLDVTQRQQMFHLATDAKSGTYAVSIPRFRQGIDKYAAPESQSMQENFSHTELVIFNQDKAEPQLAEPFSSIITALLPSADSEGYVVLDSSAEIRVVLRKGTQAVTALAQSMAAQQLDTVSDEAIVDIARVADETEVDEDLLPNTTEIQADEVDDDGTPVVSQQQLSNIFDIGPSYALPPMEDMFYQVAGLFSSKASA